MKKKRRKPAELKEAILDYLEKQTFPRTTGQIADAVRISWPSTDIYLNELKKEGIVYHEKVGRQNQWCLMEYYEPWRKKLGKMKYPKVGR